MQSLTIVVQISEHLTAPQGALIKGNVRRWPFAPDSYRHRTEAIWSAWGPFFRGHLCRIPCAALQCEHCWLVGSEQEEKQEKVFHVMFPKQFTSRTLVNYASWLHASATQYPLVRHFFAIFSCVLFLLSKHSFEICLGSIMFQISLAYLP